MIALLVTGAALPARLVAQDTGFVAWPRELASRAPALSDAIAREFRERPRMIRFGGRDTIHIVFWNPLIWQDDMDSKVLPQKTVPSIREATKNVAQYVWTTFGRDAGIAYIRVSFIRVVHDHKYWNPSHVVEAQEVGGDLTREGLETGQLPMVGIAQREGGAWSPETQKWIDSLRQARSPAIFHAMERDIGQRPTAISLTGRDTIDVSFVNPSFWWKDRFATSLPEESLPIARQTAKQVARYLWTSYARDSGINVIRVKFTRVHGETITPNNYREVPAEVVTGYYTRQQLETGKLDAVQLTIVPR